MPMCLKTDEEIKLFWFLSYFLQRFLSNLERSTGTVTSEADDVLYKREKKENWRSTAKTITHAEKATG